MSAMKNAMFIGEAPSFTAELLESGWLADIEIQCEKRTWKVHKLIICGQSNWFKSALMGNFQEAKTGVVVISNFKSEEIAVLLQFLYAGTIDVTAKFNKNAENSFVAYMRLSHMADYFQVPKLRELVLKRRDEHTLSVGKQLCLLANAPDEVKESEAAVEELFASIRELYGKYYRHGEYPSHAGTVKTNFKFCLMRLVMCGIHSIFTMASFKALLHQYLVFAADWASFLTEVVARRVTHNPLDQQGAVQCRGKHCTGDLVAVDPFQWVNDGKRSFHRTGCFKLPTLDEWKKGERSDDIALQ